MRLSASWLKVHRAGLHLRDLKRRVDRYLASAPYEAICDCRRESDEHLVRLHVRRKCPKIGIIVGEIAHQLRSALDCSIGQLIELGTGIPPPPNRDFEFPIFAEGSRYLGKARDKRILGVPKHTSAVIDAVQPFKQERPTERILWLLHRLNIADKHRELAVVGGGMPALSVTHTGSGGASNFAVDANYQPPKNFPLEDGMELFRFFSAEQEPDVQLQIQNFYLGFTSPRELYGYEVLSTMDRALREVRAILLSLEAVLEIPDSQDLQFRVRLP